jgi:hypothetical protein
MFSCVYQEIPRDNFFQLMLDQYPHGRVPWPDHDAIDDDTTDVGGLGPPGSTSI